MDYGGHQAQHTAGALELDQRRPVGIEAVEDLGVDGVGGAQPLLVIRLARLRRELLALGAVKVIKGAGHRVAGLELVRVNEWLEQAAADNLEAFFGAGRPPRCLDPADGVAQPVKRRPAALAADLDVVGHRMGRAGRVTGWQADDQQAAAGQLGRLSQGLGKREVGLEVAAGQLGRVVKLAGVGHPLVDEDEARAVVVHQFAQHVAGAGGSLVVGAQAIIGRPAAQLPGQFAPQGVDDRAVGLDRRIAGGDAVADQDDATHVRQLVDARLFHDGVDAQQFAGDRAGEEVVEGQHGVGFAAAEVGLELDDGIAAHAGQPPRAADE